MPINWEQESTDTLVVRVSGKLVQSEMLACQTVSRKKRSPLGSNM